ncbi:hypothetical protein GGQ99_000988 [Aminobacter niigataensis]|uniref:Helix-turn-helix domain-containing protein n=1 Tax=Aminobacter niigataensis TaxID=83265 RepID=A0ABR6KXX3_9HYPH|nr:helix-turn-helix domain-containing protein [Aminobacter niigataensis]MBB4649266.1 hypothetical protein [Aminobacter niigataensis]
MLSNETAGIEEVAAALGRTVGWVMRNWLRQHQLYGFPRRIPGTWTFPRRAVESWLRSGGQMPMPMPANQNEGALPDMVAAANASLRNRYGAKP